MPAALTPAPEEEAAIRCRDLAAMTAFYRDIVGLRVVEGDYPDTVVLLSVGEDLAGPPGQVALFVAEDDDEPLPAPHRLTLTVPDAEALARAEAWFRANGLGPERAEHALGGWRGVTIRDPEGNVVELVAPVPQRAAPARAWAGQG